MQFLKEIRTQYEKAEVTCLFLHDKTTGQSGTKINLLTLFELVPSEQEASPIIGDKSTGYLQRVSIDDKYTIYPTFLSP